MTRVARPPFDRMSKRERRGTLRVLAVIQLGLLIPLLVLERRMKRTGGPGIIPFELAGSPERARQIMDRWGDDGQSAARLSLVLDYPYLVAYATLQALVCAAATGRLRRRRRRALATVGAALAWSQFAAGAFDAIENAALLAVLGGRDGRLPAVARASATAKFGLIGAGWTYVGIARALDLQE